VGDSGSSPQYLSDLYRRHSDIVLSGEGPTGLDFNQIASRQVSVGTRRYEHALAATAYESSRGNPLELTITIPAGVKTFESDFRILPGPSDPPSGYVFDVVLHADNPNGKALFAHQLEPGMAAGPNEPVEVKRLERLVITLQQVSGHDDAYPALVLGDAQFR
jgi:hypothetical protein